MKEDQGNRDPQLCPSNLEDTNKFCFLFGK